MARYFCPVQQILGLHCFLRSVNLGETIMTGLDTYVQILVQSTSYFLM